MPRNRPLADRAADAVPLLAGLYLAAAVLFGGLYHGNPLVFLGFVEPLAEGRFPYRDFPVEYPPLGYLVIVLPWLVTGGQTISPTLFQTLYSIQMTLFAVATGACAVWLASRGWALGTPSRTALTYTALALCLLPVVIWRFDVVPTFFTVVALVGVALKRPGVAGSALGLGAATKVFPAFLLPVLVVFYLANRDRRAAGFAIAGFAIAATLVIAPFALAAGTGVLSFVGYQDARGVEVESTTAGVVFLLHLIAGTEPEITFGFGALQVESAFIEQLALPRRIFEGLLVVGLLGGGWLSFRADLRRSGAVQPRTLLNYLFAVLLLIMLTNKVLSPQYVVWLLPFGVLATRLQALMLFGAAVLTTLIYPLNFDALLQAEPAAVAALNVRNLLLLMLFVAVVVPRRRRMPGRSAATDVANEGGATPDDGARAASARAAGARAHAYFVRRREVRRPDCRPPRDRRAFHRQPRGW